MDHVSALSKKDRRILDLAVRETNLEHFHEFDPITHGFFWAVLGILGLGIVSVFWLLCQLIAQTVGKLLGR